MLVLQRHPFAPLAPVEECRGIREAQRNPPTGSQDQPTIFEGEQQHETIDFAFSTHLSGYAEAYARPSATPQLPPRTNQLGISKCALRASRSLSIVLYERKNTR